MWPPPILVKIVCTVAGRTNLRPWRKPINFPQLLHDLPDRFHQRLGGRPPRMLSPTQNPWHKIGQNGLRWVTEKRWLLNGDSCGFWKGARLNVTVAFRSLP